MRKNFNNGWFTPKRKVVVYPIFKDVAEIKLLTVDEEVELTRKISLGDSKAIDELVKRNLRFVIS
jgi:DNA-directed RNA polymerase sigma subunit (sigma70/sigma32)